MDQVKFYTYKKGGWVKFNPYQKVGRSTTSLEVVLLPSGSELHEVLLFGIIQEGILQALH